MLHAFLTSNRPELIARCRAKVAQRYAPGATPEKMEHGVTVFFDQLIRTLEVEQTSEPMRSRTISGPSGGAGWDGNPVLSEIGETATLHGRELLQHGFTIDQVVHDYGDVCQAVTGLAFERGAPIETEEFRTLNRCLDNAIAGAVTGYSRQHNLAAAERENQTLNERLGVFAHEMRNHVATATLALSVIKTGNVGISGATGAVLERSLVNLRHLIDRSLSQVRLTAGMDVEHRLFSLTEFIAEVKLSASLEADLKGLTLDVSVVDPLLAIDADRDLLLSAVGNLLQNAFKFTRPHATGTGHADVTLNAYASGERVLIDVEDHCGGLAPGLADTMFQPFTQGGEDRTGLGLGLSISQRSVEANGGTLSVRDVPGTGCAFTIDLPRRSLLQRLPEEPLTSAI